MSDALATPAPELAKLRTALSALTTTLEPCMARPLQDLVALLENGSSQPKPAADQAAATSGEAGTKEELDGRLDSARLQVSIAYVLLDLVWVYLKVRGIDATTHPVTTELERVKGYFDKINIAQGRAERSSDDASRSKVDTVAAGRFVRAALASGAATKPAGTHTRFEAEEESDSSDSDSSEEDKALPSTATAKAEKSAAPKVEAVKATPYAGYEEGSGSKKRKTDSSKESKKKKRKSKSGHK